MKFIIKFIYYFAEGTIFAESNLKQCNGLKIFA